VKLYAEGTDDGSPVRAAAAELWSRGWGRMQRISRKSGHDRGRASAWAGDVRRLSFSFFFASFFFPSLSFPPLGLIRQISHSILSN
jgi:hypothetical protein